MTRAAKGPSAAQALPAELRPAWRSALDAWGLGVDLSLPTVVDGSGEIAWIDLRDRQTRIDLGHVRSAGIADRMEALFAHEAGHHCRHPQTLVTSAKLLTRMRKLVTALECERPGEVNVGAHFEASHFDYLLNLLLDVRVNDELCDRYGRDYQAIYRAMVRDEPEGPASAAFAFTLALYEALWKPDPPLLATWQAPRLDAVCPQWRADSRALAAALRAAPDNAFVWLDLFVEAIWPYAVADEKARASQMLLEAFLAAGLDELQADELEQVGQLSRSEREADEQREHRRHPALVELPPDIEDEDADRPQTDPIEEGLRSLIQAGNDCGQSPSAVADSVLWYYEREAERLLIELETAERSEPLIPSTLRHWEAGCDPGSIDWAASLGRAGIALPGMTLLEREYESETTGEQGRLAPWLEIYIDSSISMPNPSRQWSHLAFAGMLLTRAALEAGSLVRLVQYAGPGDVIAMDDFSADKRTLYRALLEYIGSGTQFPFGLLAESLERYRSHARIERIAISDGDFFYNVRHGDASVLDTLRRASQPPQRMTAVLNIQLEFMRTQTPPGLTETGLRMIPIAEWNEIHGVAVRLGREIFRRGGE
ncbi:MAG: hypothetical protein JXR96_07545 [Deltaproteobacteria bacterium]|nr:hypothetical protein [Deltaproteobacteria bacterium]